MRQSHLFSKTRREAPADEESTNAKLLIRAGFIHKEMAGVYSYLPLGVRTLNKIIGIIREEMNAIGGQEVFLTSLQDPEPWKTSGRWSDDVIDVWFKTRLHGGSEIGLANTHEEALTRLMTHHVHSYKDLPVYPYQMQTKFRNELRARSGILRTREFIMKDMYSFARNEEEHRAFYEQAKQAYVRIFERVGLGTLTYFTVASGGSFSKYSHEFQVVCEAGEDTIYVSRDKSIAVNKEVFEEDVLRDLGMRREEFAERRAIEVGNIFPLGTKYSAALGLLYRNEEGKEVPAVMGSYGIGPGRVMGTLVESMHDEKGMVWPRAVAPFEVHLLALPGGEEQAEALYQSLQKEGADVLYDDRQDATAGEKLADADLIGIPARVVVSAKTAEQGSAELKMRTQEEAKLVKLSNLHAFIA